MNPTKLTPGDVNWKSVVFKECAVHTMIRYASEKCPVCQAIEERDEALGKADYEKTQLEGRIADLEDEVDGLVNGDRQ